MLRSVLDQSQWGPVRDNVTMQRKEKQSTTPPRIFRPHGEIITIANYECNFTVKWCEHFLSFVSKRHQQKRHVYFHY
jgi:hypothetical protein